MSRRLIIIALAATFALPGVGQARTGKQAFWRSLLIPGWGQRYAGRRVSGERFLMAELALWGSYFAFQRRGEVREDNLRSYAAEHARARPEGKDGQFFDDLGFYQSRLQHDLLARYEDGPNAELYPDGPEFFWEWDREESRLRYRELRNSRQSAERQALYMTGLVVANHLIAAVHAGRSVGDGEETAEEERRGARVETRFDPLKRGVNLVLVKRF